MPSIVLIFIAVVFICYGIFTQCPSADDSTCMHARVWSSIVGSFVAIIAAVVVLFNGG